MANSSTVRTPEGRRRAVREIAAVEKALREGHHPTGTRGNTPRGAISVAADRLGQQRVAFRFRVGTPTMIGGHWRNFKLKVDWSQYRKPKIEEVPAQKAREEKASRNLKADLKQLTREVEELRDIRGGILKLIEKPLRPRYEPSPKRKSIGGRTVIIHLSDLHCGEVVDLDEMGGINRYNLTIFASRIARLTTAAVELLTTHWKGKPPEKIVLIFGGDFISGEIHDELAKTNDALAAPAVRTCAETVAGLVRELAKLCPIDVYAVPGNHGRLTKKPESKGMAVNSFDTLIASVVEMVLKTSGVDRVAFYYPKSGDAVFRVYGLTFVAAHGDRIGSRGGAGFIGPIATILRGVHKVRAYYASQGIIVHYVLVGHFHSTSKLPRAFSNGSLIGPSEYSRDLRADPEEAKQNLIVIHAEKGVIDFQELKCGDASEGSIYRSVA